MKNYLLITPLIIFLTACGSDNNKNLSKLIADARLNSYSNAEKIKTLDEYKTFSYNSFDKKDPFEKYIDEKKIKKRKNSIKPNLDREKEYLEKFELSELKLTGIMKQPKNEFVAVFYDGFKNNLIKVNNHIGKNYGKIIKIEKNKVHLEEIYKEDGINLWIKKETILELNSD